MLKYLKVLPYMWRNIIIGIVLVSLLLYGVSLTKSRGCSDRTITLYHTPWCGHCKDYKPLFEKFAMDARTMYPVLRVEMVDCSTDEKMCPRSLVGYQTTITTNDAGKQSVYMGSRTLQQLHAIGTLLSR